MDTVFFNGRAALLDFIGGVRDDFSERLDRFNASKSLQRSLRSEVYEQASSSSLTPSGTAKHSEQIRVN